MKEFKLEKGAIASTVAHDSHNLIVAGTNDIDVYTTINSLRKEGGEGLLLHLRRRF